MHRIIGVFGILFLLGVAYLLSTDRKKIRGRTVVGGLFLQLVFALFVMKTTIGVKVFQGLSNGVTAGLAKANAGISFVFGELANGDRFGFVFATMALPTIIYISSFFAVLYYLGILQKLVLVMAKIMSRTMDTSGAESLSCAANVFMGQTEAPLVVMPYISKMTYSELATLMIGGMATVSGGMLAVYINYGIDARFLLAASVMNAPAAILMAKMLVPETGEPLTKGEVKLEVEREEVNIIDAAARGASAGMKLALNVAAMLVAFLSLIALVDWVLLGIDHLLQPYITPLQSVELSLSQIFAWLFAPLAFIMGVPWAEAGTVGTLFGQKLIVTELIAYQNLSSLIKAGAITPRAELISTYALCGFANLGSIAIQLGGIGGIAPTRKEDLAKLGVRAVIGGSLATFMTATIAGILN